jgi:hypothetical protein
MATRDYAWWTPELAALEAKSERPNWSYDWGQWWGTVDWMLQRIGKVDLIITHRGDVWAFPDGRIPDVPELKNCRTITLTKAAAPAPERQKTWRDRPSML